MDWCFKQLGRYFHNYAWKQWFKTNQLVQSRTWWLICQRLCWYDSNTFSFTSSTKSLPHYNSSTFWTLSLWNEPRCFKYNLPSSRSCYRYLVKRNSYWCMDTFVGTKLYNGWLSPKWSWSQNYSSNSSRSYQTKWIICFMVKTFIV